LIFINHFTIIYNHNKNCMTLTDVNILAKKIIVGFLIFVVPLVIIGGGLWLIKILLTK
jgi:hypothetical protein